MIRFFPVLGSEISEWRSSREVEISIQLSIIPRLGRAGNDEKVAEKY